MPDKICPFLHNASISVKRGADQSSYSNCYQIAHLNADKGEAGEALNPFLKFYNHQSKNHDFINAIREAYLLQMKAKISFINLSLTQAQTVIGMVNPSKIILNIQIIISKL